MFTISKRYSICCSHILTGLPEGHPCGRLHGHNYEVEFIAARDSLTELGFVVDYNDIDKHIGVPLAERFDHRHLNDFCPQPTAENLAMMWWGMASNTMPELTWTVRVSETPKTWAEYSE